MHGCSHPIVFSFFFLSYLPLSTFVSVAAEAVGQSLRFLAGLCGRKGGDDGVGETLQYYPITWNESLKEEFARAMSCFRPTIKMRQEEVERDMPEMRPWRGRGKQRGGGEHFENPREIKEQPKQSYLRYRANARVGTRFGLRLKTSSNATGWMDACEKVR